jgi:hypothetical protein
VRRRLTLSQWYARLSRQAMIDEYIEYSSCQCMIE